MLLSCLNDECPGEIDVNWDNMAGDVVCPECGHIYAVEYEEWETGDAEDWDWHCAWWLVEP